MYVYLLGNILSRTRICGNYSGLNNSATHNVQRNSDNNDNRDKQQQKTKTFSRSQLLIHFYSFFTGTLLKAQNKDMLERRSEKRKRGVFAELEKFITSVKFKNRHTSDVLTSAEKLVCPASGCCLSKVDLIPGNKTFGDDNQEKETSHHIGVLPFFAPL